MGNGTVETVVTAPHSFSDKAEFEFEGSGAIDNIEICRPPECGDGNVDMPDETCDDGNTVTEVCTYGQMTCQVCDTSCQDVMGAAFTFVPGENTFGAEAVDRAGNVGTATTSIEVIPTHGDLCTLGQMFLSASQLTPAQASPLVKALCRELTRAERLEARGRDGAAARLIEAYIATVAALTPPHLTGDQRGLLITWAQQL